MRKVKIPIYIGIELLLLIMARLLFINAGKIGSVTSETPLFDQVSPILQNLYILHALLVFIPFLVILGLIIREIVRFSKEKKEALEKKQEVDSQAQEEVQVDEEELRKEQEKLLQTEIVNRRQQLYQCIEKTFKENASQEHKIISEKILGCLAHNYEITQGEIFLRQKTEETDSLVLSATYAFYIPEEKVYEFQMGEGLIGQVAKAAEALYLDELPQGYITTKSGLGSATPSHLLIVPWKASDDSIFAVLELASFKPFEKYDIELIEGLSEKIREYYV